MARTISDEQIKLSVIIDGNPAQKEIYDLEKSSISLKQKINELTQAQKENKKELDNVSNAYNKQKNRLEEVDNSMKKLNQQYDIESAKLKQIETSLGSSSREFKIQKAVIDNIEKSYFKLGNEQSKLQTELVKISPKLKELIENESIYKLNQKPLKDYSFFIWKDSCGNEYKVLACGIDKKTLLVYHPEGVKCNVKFNHAKNHIYPRDENYILKPLIKRV